MSTQTATAEATYTMTVEQAEQTGREAFANGEHGALALNAAMCAELKFAKVGDKSARKLMEAFSRGYQSAHHEWADAEFALLIER